MWAKESTKFFDRGILHTTLWTAAEWGLHKKDRTRVWIVCRTMLQPNSIFMNLMEDPSLVFTSIFYDEPHMYGRYPTSNTVQMMRKLNERSNFRVFISGTPFTRGPREDARGYLFALNGPFIHAAKSWSRPMARALGRLLDGEDYEFNVLVLRMILMPLTLRRTSRSTWDGDYIVTQKVKSQPPTLICPSREDDIEIQAKKLFHREHESENMKKKMQRADFQRYFA